MKKVEVRELAYCRSGDKGDISNVGVLAFNEKNYEILLKQLTPERIKAHYKGIVKGDIEIYPMPNLNAIEVVMHNALRAFQELVSGFSVWKIKFTHDAHPRQKLKCPVDRCKAYRGIDIMDLEIYFLCA